MLCLGLSVREMGRSFSHNKELIDYLMLLRYGNSCSLATPQPLLNISSIAKLTGLSVNTVSRLLKLGLSLFRKSITLKPRKRSKLTEEHMQFLKDQSTLRAWAHLSLKQRAVMFHRQFTDIKISSSLLQREYKKLGIKFKFI